MYAIRGVHLHFTTTKAVTYVRHILSQTSHPSISHVHVPKHAYTGPLITIPPVVPPAVIDRQTKTDMILERGELPPDPTMVLQIVKGTVAAKHVTRYRRQALAKWFLEQAAYLAVAVAGIAVGGAVLVLAVLIAASSM